MERRPAPRRTTTRPGRHSGAGGTLFGIFVGLVIGLGLAAGVAFWLMRNNPAMQASVTAAARDSVRDGKAAPGTPDKPRFDFYKILPGVEEPKVAAERKAPDRSDRTVAQQSRERPGDATPLTPADKAAPAAAPPPAGERVANAEPSKGPKPGDRYWLQAGSFSAQADAENLKARLALAGWEANVQEGNVPDKGMRYRVRLGPYDDADELSRMKSELARRGFDVAVIKY